MNSRPPFITFCAAAIVCISQAVASPRVISMEEGQQRTWSQARPIKRAATANDDIVGINVVPPKGIVITAKKAGTAMVSVWDESQPNLPTTQIQIVVGPSTAAARQTLGSDAQQASLTADGTKLRLSGTLSSLERHAAIEAALKSVDDKVPNVVDTSVSNFDVQVQIDLKIVEVSRRRLREAGFYHDRTTSNATYGLGSPNSLASLVTDPTTGRSTINAANGFLPRGDAFNIFRWGPRSLTVFSALEANGFAYTLAEPSLTALSGQTAFFLAGGELPIPLRSGSGGDSSVTVQFKEFGIRLSLTPTVLDQNRITLKVAPEVSEVDNGLAVTSGGFAIPGLRVRRTETTVAMGDGETFVISGLVNRNTSSSVDKFPILGDIPILGAFFRSTRFDREDKELLMIATAHLVRPFAKNAKLLPLPGDEVRNYDPSFLRLFLLETGRFKQQDSGFSQ